MGKSYSQSVTASGGTAPYTYTISAGTLPTGVTLYVSLNNITNMGAVTSTVPA